MRAMSPLTTYGTFSYASDMWGYGITPWEMFSYGEPLYEELMGGEVRRMLVGGCC